MCNWGEDGDIMLLSRYLKERQKASISKHNIISFHFSTLEILFTFNPDVSTVVPEQRYHRKKLRNIHYLITDATFSVCLQWLSLCDRSVMNKAEDIMESLSPTQVNTVRPLEQLFSVSSLIFISCFHMRFCNLGVVLSEGFIPHELLPTLV